jgi:O-antigen/teichoic acid export membrane protein
MQARKHGEPVSVINAVLGAARAPATSLRSGIFGSALIQGAGMLMVFLLHVVMARVLGQAEYGEYAYFSGWINVVAIFAKLGTDRAMVRYVSAAAASHNWVEVQRLMRHTLRLVLWSTIVSTIAATALFLLVGNRRGEYSLTTGAWSIIAMITLVVCMWQKGALIGLRLVAQGRIPTEVAKPLVILVVLLALVAWGVPVDATTAMIVTVPATVVAILLGLWYWTRAVRGRVSDPDAAPGELPGFHALYPFVLISVAHMVERYIDVLMVGAISGPEEVAAYSVAARISGIVALGMHIASPALQPFISRLHARGQMAENVGKVARITLGVFVITTLAALPLLLFGDTVLSLFGDGFPVATPVLTILTLSQVVNTFCGPTGVWLSMTGHQRLASRGLWIGAGVNVLLNSLLIPQYGAVGAATGTAISVAVWNAMLVYYIRRELGVNPTVFGAWRMVRRAGPRV